MAGPDLVPGDVADRRAGPHGSGGAARRRRDARARRERRRPAGGAGPAEGSDDADEVARAFTRSQIRELALEAIHAQREALLDARGEGLFSSVALDGALARLDNEEILLVSGSHGLDH